MAGCDATGEAPGKRPCEPGGIGGYGRGIGEGQEPAVGPDQGGASVSEGEAAGWVCQGALLRAGEEHGTAIAAVRAGQPACGAGTTEGVSGPRGNHCRPAGLHKTQNGPAEGQNATGRMPAEMSRTSAFAHPPSTQIQPRPHDALPRVS